MPLADPSELACFTDDGEAIHVIVETPKGSRNKFAFDESRKVFRLKKVLPVGMAFPYDLDSYLLQKRRMATQSTFWF